MIKGRLHIGHRQRFVVWLLPLLSLALAILACSIVSVAPRRGVPPPVTYLPASQLRLEM